MSIKSSQNDPFIIWFHQQWIKSYLLRKLSQSSFFPSPPSLSCSFPSVYAIISKITLKLLNPFWVMFQSDRDCKGRKRHIGWQFSSNYKNTFLEFVLDQLLLFPEALNCGIHNWFCGWIQVGSLYLEVHFFLRGEERHVAVFHCDFLVSDLTEIESKSCCELAERVFFFFSCSGSSLLHAGVI